MAWANSGSWRTDKGVITWDKMIDLTRYTPDSSHIAQYYSLSQVANNIIFGNVNLYQIYKTIGANNHYKITLPQGQYFDFVGNSSVGNSFNFSWSFCNSDDTVVESNTWEVAVPSNENDRYLSMAIGINEDIEELTYIWVWRATSDWGTYQTRWHPNATAKRNALYQWLGSGYEPIEYNYTPIDYITDKTKVLKLSKIKATSTNHGESNITAELSDFERFTDGTNLYEYAKNMANGESVIIGYTAPTNYVQLKRIQSQTGQTGNVEILCKLEYYEEGLHHSTMDCEVPYMWYTSADNFKTFYYSLLIDKAHNACRQSLIEISRVPLFDVPTDVRGYNFVENDAGLITDTYQSNMFIWLSNGYEDGDIDNPYEYGGTSEENSGDGEWDNTSDTIGIPTAPSVNISDTGFITVFNPTLSQLKDLADYMWAGAFDVSVFKRVMANPMDAIIGFSLVPCDPTVSGVETVKIGNIDSNISMNVVSDQYVDVDCGTIKLEEYWGNYLDYAPYTKINLVLPFIGSVQLSPDDCMKKTIGITYRIDLLSGGCVAYITCDGSVMYQYSGSCSAQLPLTGLDFRNMISSLISIGTTAVGLGTAIASGGITAPMVAVGIGNTANNVMNGKPTIEHGGSLGSASGFLGVRVPYLIITRPRQCVPEKINKFKGLPSLITSKLKNVTGFTQVHEIHLDAVPCSDEEKRELKSILESGVII